MIVVRMRGIIVTAFTLIPIGIGACVAVPDYEVSDATPDQDAQVTRDAGDANSVRDTSNSNDGSSDGPSDGGPREASPPPDAASLPRLVFVSSTTSTGAMGGLAGADSKCKSLADSSGVAAVVNRNWRAWLSTSTIQARERIPMIGGAGGGIPAYRLVSGDLVFPEGFVFGPKPGDAGGPNLPLRVIDQDERGQTIAASGVWTGTQNDGSRCGSSATSFCDDWSTTNGGSCYGYVSGVSAWSSGSGGSATTLNRIYCFEVP